MKIDGNNFYLLDTNDEKWIFNTEEEAIQQLKASKNTDPEKVRVLEIDSTGDEWQIKQVSWAKIAMKLMGGGKWD